MTKQTWQKALVMVTALVGLWAGVRAYRSGSTGGVALENSQMGRVQVIDFGAEREAFYELGKVALGSISPLSFGVTGVDGGAIGEVASSCACLRMGLTGGKGAESAISGRYFAVNSGKVDVTLAVSRVDAGGKEAVATIRVIGEVLPGDPAVAARLSAIARTPLLDFGVEEPGLRTEAGVANAAVKAGRAMVIDVRAAEEYAESHVVGSLNIPVSQLKVSPAFRGRDLYLTGPALVTGPLQQACVQLRKQTSAKVFVVLGGVQGWEAAGAAVFHQLDPRPVIGAVGLADAVERVAGQGAVFGAAGVDDFDRQYFFPESEALPEAAGAWREWVEGALRKTTGPVVLVDVMGDRFGVLNQGAPASWLGRVFYLRAPVSMYQEAVSRMATLAAAEPGQGTSSVHGFARSDRLRRANLPSVPGCGTCPK